MAKARKFSGFGVVTRQGLFLWQYARPEEVETREAYARHNPEVEGHPDGHKVVGVALRLTDLEENQA